MTKRETGLFQAAWNLLRGNPDPVEAQVSYDLRKNLASPSRRGAGFTFSGRIKSKMNTNIPREEHSEEQLKSVTTRGAMKKWV